MKIWFDQNDVNFLNFTSEQFLLLPYFSSNIINNDNDFKNNNWTTNIKKVVSIADISEADFLLYPKKFDTGISKYIQLGKKHNKKVYSFYNDDNDLPISDIENLVLYRTSINASKKKKNEFAMPAWSRDLYKPEIPYRSKQQKPVVSFCGFISHPIRKTCLNILETNNFIDKNFIIRKQFWAGSPHNPLIREEYVNNIVNSDFVLCCRGAGNFSYRLYETLSCGRIPIIINTDSVFPCDDKINWNDISIFISDPNNLNEKLNIFWNDITDENYINLQKKIRKIYENYIAPDGFANYLNYNI